MVFYQLDELYPFRLRNSAVLLAGLTGVGAEVAKNLMLAGIKKLVLMDNEDVTEDDLANQFLIAPNSVGKNVRCPF